MALSHGVPQSDVVPPPAVVDHLDGMPETDNIASSQQSTGEVLGNYEYIGLEEHRIEGVATLCGFGDGTIGYSCDGGG